MSDKRLPKQGVRHRTLTDYVLGQRQRQRDVFVPLRHDPGHARADFGEALAVIGGVERKVHITSVALGYFPATAFTCTESESEPQLDADSHKGKSQQELPRFQ
ncbi:MAG: hypothetical protein HIU82_16375 [Proteobacteria bacterium]|nr:hypothetical protein [Pseudomonadota bacterium]